MNNDHNIDPTFLLLEAFYLAGGFTTRSDYARNNAELIAQSAVLGLISVETPRDGFSTVWRLTPAGLVALFHGPEGLIAYAQSLAGAAHADNDADGGGSDTEKGGDTIVTVSTGITINNNISVQAVVFSDEHDDTDEDTFDYGKDSSSSGGGNEGGIGASGFPFDFGPHHNECLCYLCQPATAH